MWPMQTSIDTAAFLTERLKAGQFTRVVAFGSSNTERRIAGMHWFDCFELACRSTFGPHLCCINSGRGGDTTGDLLTRIERDCLAHRPHIAFITIGGNDSNPDRAMTPAAYRDNLANIVRQLQAADIRPVLQTYYAIDAVNMYPQHGPTFNLMMEAMRELSRQTGCLLIDHLMRWERLRHNCYDIYRSLLQDPLHLNAAGNLVVGMDIARTFAAKLPDEPYFQQARITQALLDRLP